MADAVVSVFLEKVVKILQEETQILSGYKKQFDNLQNELQYMQSFLKDAERRKRKDETLRCTLVNLCELIYEAEDILADCELFPSNSGKFLADYSFCLSPSEIPSKYQRGKKLKQINEKITGIKDKITSYLVPQLLTQSVNGKLQEDAPPRWSSPVYDHTQVVGLEGDTKKVKDWLFKADKGIIQAIGIVGMGGLGKTTLAHKVFNDKEVEFCFEKRIWVSVSQSFTEERILRSILRNLGDADIGDDNGELLKRIYQFLLGKRFLIVMDDVWSVDCSWWKRIYEGLPKGNGSCFIVTTRNERVARNMGVQEVRIHCPRFLGEGDSWLLFCNVAFAASHGVCISNGLEKIGKDIVSKCRGLPLAIKAVGGMMLCKQPSYGEWRQILNYLRDELAENDDSVMASLQLSYDELPSYLKSCFLSLSIYPEDCVISKDQLVRWWIGEGFVPVRNGRLSTEASEDCFTGLTNRCLVEVVDWEYNGKICTCRVHDMVRDLLVKVSADEHFSGLKIASSRHLGINSDIKENHIERHATKKNLRALVSTSRSGEVNKIGSCIGKKLCDFQYLQVLDLSKSIFEVSLAVMLDKIGNLKHLACLSLSNTHPLKEVPLSLQKVSNLQILDLSYCQSLKFLPSFVMSFHTLVVLDVSNCGSLYYLPKGVGTLTNLQVLLGFKPCRKENRDCYSRLAELRNLTQLRTLGLQFTRADEIDENDDNTLAELEELHSLTISCFNSCEKELVQKLEKLSPPSKLHEISLKFYPGKTTPKWLNPTSLPVLQYISITGGNISSLRKTFWGNTNANACWGIKGLNLYSLSHLCIEWEMLQQKMLSLRTVYASWCPKLKSFPIDGVGFRGGVWRKGKP